MNRLFKKILVLSLVSSFGTASIAANAVANTLANIQYMTGAAFSNTMVAVVGRCVGAEEKEQAKMDVVLSIFKEIKSTPEGSKKYKDVYLIFPDACPDSHEASVDGVHPDNYGYTLWAKSIQKPVVRILKKYGIRRGE